MRPYVSIYTRSAVEAALPTIWSDDACRWGIARDYEPDDDMPPPPPSDPSHSHTLWAVIGDVRSAWSNTDLTLKERRAVFLRYALGWTEQDIAAHEGVHQTTAMRRFEAAVGKLTAYLNGERYVDGYDPALEEVC